MLDPKEWSSIEVTRRARLVNSLVLVPFKIVATSITSLACFDLTWFYVKVSVLIKLIDHFGVKLTHLSRGKSQS